jgi:hypothetical protein
MSQQQALTAEQRRRNDLGDAHLCAEVAIELRA